MTIFLLGHTIIGIRKQINHALERKYECADSLTHPFYVLQSLQKVDFYVCVSRNYLFFFHMIMASVKVFASFPVLWDLKILNIQSEFL